MKFTDSSCSAVPFFSMLRNFVKMSREDAFKNILGLLRGLHFILNDELGAGQEVFLGLRVWKHKLIYSCRVVVAKKGFVA